MPEFISSAWQDFVMYVWMQRFGAVCGLVVYLMILVAVYWLERRANGNNKHLYRRRRR